MTEQDTSPTERVSTFSGCTISILGVLPEEFARHLGQATELCLRECGKGIDLGTLDGVTIAEDYLQALNQQDRGYQTNHVLTPTKDMATGVAMSPRVLRDGQVKTHILLDASVFKPLADTKEPGFAQAFYLLAHECAHVEVTARFDSVFPGELLRRTFHRMEQKLQWDVILPAWDEYAACRRSCGIGADQTEHYELILLDYLEKTPAENNAAISAYQKDLNGDQLLREVYRVHGDLLRIASYYLGHLAGAGESWQGRAAIRQALTGSWFHPFLERLDACLTSIWAEYGKWEDQSDFEEIGAIVDDMTEQAGVYWIPMQDGNTQVQLTDNAFLD
ncbi:hypothetical protein [Pseudomonas sp. PLMAX]|uniref:hypothetical protein n=1 Tax=Pseudomonas sp. PLMAX TaxID=2201998 RepID=UPI0038B812B2